MIALASGFIMPLWFQLGMGMSAAKAGTIMLFSAIGTVASRLAGVRLTQVLHPRTVTVGSATLLVPALLLTAQLDRDWPLLAFYAVLAFQAIVLSLSMMVTSAVAYVEIEQERMGQAASLFTTVQQVTMSLGVTLGVWVISGMRLFYSTTEHDSRVYGASLVILALFAMVGAYTIRNLDADSTGALRGSGNRRT